MALCSSVTKVPCRKATPHSRTPPPLPSFSCIRRDQRVPRGSFFSKYVRGKRRRRCCDESPGASLRMISVDECISSSSSSTSRTRKSILLYVKLNIIILFVLRFVVVLAYGADSLHTFHHFRRSSYLRTICILHTIPFQLSEDLIRKNNF